MAAMQTWDIFCTVIDNYGDIGITWRLARQLADEHGIRPRLWVDDLSAFRAIRPEVDPALPRQILAGVEIRRWTEPLPNETPGEVVIEALACNLPEPFMLAMAARQPSPVWLNLEYLSAEDWVRGCHGLPSPHPRLPLTKYFFMPGYVPGTGGVLKEAWLGTRRDRFQASPEEQAEFWRAIGVPALAPDATRVSLFAYETHSVGGLLDRWAEAAEPVELFVPAGKVLPGLAAWLGEHPRVGGAWQRGRLRVHALPMLDQDAYDRLLWACDCNFVRGEDSFVRAQWARRPLVWQAYRQDEGAHWPKIEAFLNLYVEALDIEAAAALRGLWMAWNRDQAPGEHWDVFWRQRPALVAHADRWAGKLATVGDLAANLVRFCHQKSQ
jgi:uncharacterized repeat protein (TIGR03837 family)